MEPTETSSSAVKDVAEVHFTGFKSTFRGGLNVASGDLTGDSIPDLVLGAGAEGGPVVLVFDGNTGTRVAQFLAGPEQDRSGVRVVVRDLDENGVNELVTQVSDVTRVFDPLTGDDMTGRFTADQLGEVFVG
jgi:hypothetical protein